MTDDVLDERAAALESGPCGQDGAIARVSSLLSHPGMWDAPPDLPGGIAALIARAEEPSTAAEPLSSPVRPKARGETRRSDSRPPRGPSADRARPGAKRRRRQWATAAALALVLIGGSIGAVL